VKRLTTSVAVAIAVCTLAFAIGASAAPAKKAIKGEITLKVGEPESPSAGLTGVSAEVSGKLKTKLICADFRQFRVKLLDPPPGYVQLGPLYGNRDKSYGDVVDVPSEPGVYSFQARAKKTKVARGLKRAKCAKIKSPVVSVTVTPEPIEP
jgi:hypothetical protein